MVCNWKQVLWLFVAAVTSLVIVSDVDAWPFRRRRSYNRGYSTARMYNYGAGYGTYGAGANVGVEVPDASVTAPGVDVGVQGGAGAAVRAPGVGVDAGRGGASVAAPGVNVGVGAGARTQPSGAGANIRGGANVRPAGAEGNLRVRGQTPDSDAAPPPAPPGAPPAP